MTTAEMTIDELLDKAEALGFEFGFTPGSTCGAIQMVTPVLPTGDGNNARCLEVTRELYRHWPAYEACIEIRLYRREGVIR